MPTSHIINDRRNKPERRESAVVSQFPFITTQGSCIRKDRRAIPERRISKIIVKEWQIRESIFETLFSKKAAKEK